MIKISNLSKSFKKKQVLKNIDLELPRTGLVVVCGPSGCGKTTLLNCLATLYDFQGNITFNGLDYKCLSDNNKSSLRIKDIGFVYQDCKLFNEESIKTNISLPFCVLFGSDSSLIKRKCIEVLEIVGLEKDIETKVNQLSGGQKQKVAIGRAIVNNPKMLLCDEPTGSLDSKNKEEIMKVLKKISCNSLVIIVSHDVSISKKYADRFIYMKDGQIIEDQHLNTIKVKDHLLMKKNRRYLKKEKLPFSFLLRHVFSIIKSKKVRSSISLMAMSLGLVGFGFSLSLSSIISENIKNTYSKVIDEERIVIQQRENVTSRESRKTITYEEALKIKDDYPYYVEDVGLNYIADFENFFPTANEAILSETNYKYSLKGLNARSINEFRWLELNQKEIYPYDYKKITNGEVILALTIDMINSICYEYRIVRSVESLRDYLKTKPIPIQFNFENINWQYSDSFVVNMVGFTLEDRPAIYHSNHLWNKVVFENILKFPVSQNVTGVLSKPWYLRGVPFLYTFDNRDTFLDIALESLNLSQYLFEISDEIYFPYKDINSVNNYSNRLLIFQNNLKTISPIYSKLLMNSYNYLNSGIFGTNYGYFIYPDMMLMGFANFTYFSSDLVLLEKVVDDSSYIDSSSNTTINYPEGVLLGHYSQENAVSFVPTTEEDSITGHFPFKYSEIIISSELSKYLFGSMNSIGKDLYVSMVVQEKIIDEKTIFRDFKTVALKIVGVKTDNRFAVFHNTNWSILFFETQMEISIFNLACNNISFKVDRSISKNEFINEFNSNNSHFKDLEALDPMATFTSGLDEVCNYLKIALVIFSSVAIVVSVLLLSMTNYLFVIENKKDFGFLRCIGLSKFESFKLLLTNGIIYGFVAFVLSIFELLIMSVFIGWQLSMLLGSEFLFLINPFSLILMFTLTLFMAVLSSFVFSRKIWNLNPIDALKS